MNKILQDKLNRDIVNIIGSYNNYINTRNYGINKQFNKILGDTLIRYSGYNINIYSMILTLLNLRKNANKKKIKHKNDIKKCFFKREEKKK